MKYIWAAYRRGVFGEDEFEPDLEPIEFALKFSSAANALINNGTEMVIVRADTALGNVPVCLISIDSNDRLAWPSVYWFPNASPRNKIEVGVKFFRDLKKTHFGLLPVRPQFAAYYRHLAKYGLLRQIGMARGFYGPEDDAILFQTVGN